MANFYTDSGADEQALRAALSQLRTLAKQGTAGVFLMMKASLQDATMLGDIIGKNALNSLGKTGTATALGLRIVLLTAKETKKISLPGPVLALYVSEDALRKLGGSVSDVIFVPWSKEELATVLKAGGNWKKI
jgi:hypothetical protein